MLEVECLRLMKVPVAEGRMLTLAAYCRNGGGACDELKLYPDYIGTTQIRIQNLESEFGIEFRHRQNRWQSRKGLPIEQIKV